MIYYYDCSNRERESVFKCYIDYIHSYVEAHRRKTYSKVTLNNKIVIKHVAMSIMSVNDLRVYVIRYGRLSRIAYRSNRLIAW